MSAFLCSDKHISAIIEYGSIQGCSMYQKGGKYVDFKGNEIALAQKLKQANVASINERYDEGEECEPIKFQTSYSEFGEAPYSAIQIVKLCDSFNYQACEVEDYEETEAFRIVETVKSWACRRVDGYDDAEWAI